MKRLLLVMLTIALCCIAATSALADPPVNDSCAYATDAGTLTSGFEVNLTGTVTDATQDCDYLGSSEVWIKFTITDCMDVTIDFCEDENSVAEVSYYLFSECPCAGNIYYDDDNYCEENENPSLTWYSLAAGTYYYAIQSSSLSASTYTVSITGTDCPEVPANDSCANAMAVGEITEQAYTTHGASFDGEGTCMSSPNIWYVYTPTFSGNARVSLEADYNERLAVYDGDDCSPLPTELGCTRDGYVDFTVVAGEQYLIEVGGTSSNFGSGTITIGEGPEPAPNDDCADATDAGTLVSGDEVDLAGTVIGAEQDCENTGGAEVWVKFTIDNCMDVTIDFCEDENGVYDGADYLFAECPCGERKYADYDDFCGNFSSIFYWYNLAAGTYYYPIVADDLNDENYVVSITGENCPEPSENDSCANATAVGEVTELDYTTRGATFDGEGTCMSGPNVWYVYTPTFTGTARVSLDPEYSEKLAVYDGGDCSPLPTQFDCTTSGKLDFAVVAGEQYLIEVGGTSSNAGDGTITIGEAPPPMTNDDCVDATDAGTLDEGVTAQITGNNEDATSDCDYLDYPEAWVQFTLDECMDVTLDLCGTSPVLDFYYVYFYLFDGCPCEEANRISYFTSDYCEDSNTSITWLSLPTGTYYYPVMKSGSNGVDYVVNIVGTPCTPSPENDDCENATNAGTLQSEVPVELTGSNAGSTNDCDEYSYAEAWIMFTTPSIMQVTVEYCGTDPSFANVTSRLYDSCPCGEDYVRSDSSGLCEDGNRSSIWYDLPAGAYYYPVRMQQGAMGDYLITVTGISTGTAYEYLPGDANMAAGTWPAQTIGGDVTYLVNYFRGLADPCNLDGFYASADATGDCMVVGGDVTYLVNYFRGLADMSYCSDYEPAWPTPSDVPTEAPDGWPNCD